METPFWRGKRELKMFYKLPDFIMIADKCENGFAGKFQKKNSLGKVNPYFPEIFFDFFQPKASRHFSVGVRPDKCVKFSFYVNYFRWVVSFEAVPERTVKRKCHSEVPEIVQSVLSFSKTFFAFSFFRPVRH